MRNTKEFLNNRFYIELLVAITLFIVAAFTGLIVEFIIYMLYFIIFLEIIRAVASYIREQRVKIGLLIDAFIILTLREFIVNVVKINKEDLSSFDMVFSSSVNFNILIFSGVLVFLFALRHFANKTTPSDVNNIEK